MRKISYVAAACAAALLSAACDRAPQAQPLPEAKEPAPAKAATQPTPQPPATAARGVEDPLALVRSTYEQYRGEDSNPRYPEHAYSDRLRALIERDRREVPEGIGRIGFDYWIVGQDWRLSDLQIEEEHQAGTPERRVIRASFRNLGTPETNRFEFVRVGGRWLIDEIRNERRPGAEGSGWVLSELLSAPLESTP